jgi:hypothetical protein
MYEGNFKMNQGGMKIVNAILKLTITSKGGNRVNTWNVGYEPP